MRNFTCISVALLLALPAVAMADDYMINQNINILDLGDITQSRGGSNIQALNNAELNSTSGKVEQKAVFTNFNAIQTKGAENLQAINRVVLDDTGHGTRIVQEVEADVIRLTQEGGNDNQQAANYAEFAGDAHFVSIAQTVSADDVYMKQIGGNDNLQSLNSIKLLR
ncbi:MAG: hypothetical protein MJK10_15705 [Pseudomonadales bacterium]|nr:hypothetical protein [Pseudomonadales bacterium]NRA17550.1 hypothetical protein [Oceanospirillaceae bacterium]